MKKLLALILALTLVLGVTTTYASAEGVTAVAITSAPELNTLDKANILKELGLFLGSDTGFNLDKAPTRVEAIVLLLRTLGEEEVAKISGHKNPFKDVPAWAASQVAYAYAKGYTKGVSETAFGSSNIVTPDQFMTFMLRALGYDDSAGDFVWNKAIEKAETLGIVALNKYSKDMVFLRGDCVDIIYSVLTTRMKASPDTLAEVLIKKAAIDPHIAAKHGLYDLLETFKYELEKDTDGSYYILSKDLLAQVEGSKYISTSYTNNYSIEEIYLTSSLTSNPEQFTGPNGSQFLLSKVKVSEVEQPNRLFFVFLYDDKGALLAGASSPYEEINNTGTLTFTIKYIDGPKIYRERQESFKEFMAGIKEYKDVIASIDEGKPDFYRVNKKTGEEKHTPYSKTTDSYVKFTYDFSKYPELAENVAYIFDFFNYPQRTTRQTIEDMLWRSHLLDRPISESLPTDKVFSEYNPTTNAWIRDPNWKNTPKFLIFKDEHNNILGYTTFIPSQHKINTEYIDIYHYTD